MITLGVGEALRCIKEIFVDARRKFMMNRQYDWLAALVG